MKASSPPQPDDVHGSLKAEFIERFAASVTALKTGDPTRHETEVGPLITPREASRVEEWTDEAVAGGARLIGGGRISDTTLQPAILVEPPPDSRLSTLQASGPVTCLYGFSDLDDAIARANALPVAFQASIFTRNPPTAFHASEHLDASAVMINDHTAFRTDWMPFAGRRESRLRDGAASPGP